MHDIAAAGGSPDADDLYFDFVATRGRLLVAVDEASSAVVALAGSIAVGDVAMVTDLFVDEAHRGRGIGGSLLAAVTDGWTRRMTFSSTNPGAVPTYAAVGMGAQWDLLTLRGTATGGGSPLVEATWRHGRRELVEYFRSRGATIGTDSVVHTGEVATVLRLISETPAADAAALLAALPAGTSVEWSLPEPHPLTPWLLSAEFVVVDRDVFCATEGIHLAPQVCSVHRGLM